MSQSPKVRVAEFDVKTMGDVTGRLAVIVSPEGDLDPGARSANRLCKGALARMVEGEGLKKAKAGDVLTLAWPAGLLVKALDVVILPKKPTQDHLRGVGAKLAERAGEEVVTFMAGSLDKAEELALGFALRSYSFDVHKSEPGGTLPELVIAHKKPETLDGPIATALALVEGVHMTRDLVSEPANVLTTTEFANRLVEMEKLGLTVEVLEEDQLAELGMRTLLSVGQGSDSPSKVVVMQWNGGTKGDAPLALVGKGVVFDTGGISLKPAAGMEDMTMDMGGAGTVAGTMRALALRKAKANVVGLVGLVENMPSGNATRPGDVVKSMKGDTVEIINTDAEGRLVLCDVLWYAQERFEPSGVIDLATLTGAIIIGLGHENAGVFSNDDTICNNFLSAAAAEGEGAWRMPLSAAYDRKLKSPIADMKNIGGRPAGSITAAQFLQRFIKDGVPWIHLDIAGVASVASGTPFAPKGSTGWGVLALSRLVQDHYEAK